MRFCLNRKPTTNDVYWRNRWIFLYFFVRLLRALPTFLFGKLLLFFIIQKYFQNHVVFADRMSFRRLAKLCKNPRAPLNLSVQCKRMNKIWSFWARTTTVFVFKGYLSRINCQKMLMQITFKRKEYGKYD